MFYRLIYVIDKIKTYLCKNIFNPSAMGIQSIPNHPVWDKPSPQPHAHSKKSQHLVHEAHSGIP